MSKAKETKAKKEVPVKGKQGRPVVAGSKRQARLEAQAAKIAAGGEIKQGRPSNPESKRQARLAAQAARVAAGGEIKVGRPKGSGKEKAEPKVKAKAEPKVKKAKKEPEIEMVFTPEGSDEGVAVDFKASPVALK